MLFADDSGGDERKSDGGLGCGLQVTADQRCCLYVDLVQLTHRSVSDDSPVSLGTTQRSGVHQQRHNRHELQYPAQQQLQHSLNASGFDVSFHLDESNAAIAAGSSPPVLLLRVFRFVQQFVILLLLHVLSRVLQCYTVVCD